MRTYLQYITTEEDTTVITYTLAVIKKIGILPE